MANALREAMDRGLIYWEPVTTRGHLAKAAMLARYTRLLDDATLLARNGGEHV